MFALFRQYRQMIIYIIIGCTGATLDFIIFSLLIHFDILHYVVANIVSVSLAITNNFLLNAFFNFKMRDQFWKRFFSFYAIGVLGLIVTSACLYLFVAVFHFEVHLSKFLIIFVAFLLQYNLNKRYSFKQFA
ncbi:MAG: GtrA family protein [Candidatus Kerfeldbacteria bacterium]|nr:GtrA family protein [Candidatus Kerfeldbacteria bacterium]